MKNIIVFGPPGSGKGTYSSRIAPKLNIPHISTGDIFRQEISAQSELGKRIEEMVKTGALVPDETVIEVVKKRLEQEDAQNGYILDGFPRTIKQAEMLEEFTSIDIVINLSIPEDILMEKALARRICEKCENVYNIADINRDGINMPPLMPEKEGVCDKCSGVLIQRKDDNEETIKDRLQTYKNQSEPLIEYFKEKEIVRDVKVVGPPEVMVPIIMEELKK